MSLDTLSVARAHGGTQHVVKHASRATGTDMTFSVFVPPQADDGALRGLTLVRHEGLVRPERSRGAHVWSPCQRPSTSLGTNDLFRQGY